MDGMNNKLDALWADYRDACPDPEPSAQFMPALWKRIEAQRAATTLIFRRLARVCVVGTLALTGLMGVVLIPYFQDAPVYSNASYVDVLAADLANTYVDLLNGDVK